MSREQKRIENELITFEKNIFGNIAKRDSLDSIAVANKDVKVVKKRGRRNNRSSETKVTKTRRSRNTSSDSKSAARVSVRRQRH